eukprot:scaffold1740_cov109-Isochrysis_galbana.AAC.1
MACIVAGSRGLTDLLGCLMEARPMCSSAPPPPPPPAGHPGIEPYPSVWPSAVGTLASRGFAIAPRRDKSETDTTGAPNRYPSEISTMQARMLGCAAAAFLATAAAVHAPIRPVRGPAVSRAAAPAMVFDQLKKMVDDSAKGVRRAVAMPGRLPGRSGAQAEKPARASLKQHPRASGGRNGRPGFRADALRTLVWRSPDGCPRRAGVEADWAAPEPPDGLCRTPPIPLERAPSHPTARRLGPGARPPLGAERNTHSTRPHTPWPQVKEAAAAAVVEKKVAEKLAKAQVGAGVWAGAVGRVGVGYHLAKAQ